MKNQNQNNITENQAVIIEPITPHPEPVAIGELLTPADIEAVLKRHVILSEAAATALAAFQPSLLDLCDPNATRRFN